MRRIRVKKIEAIKYQKLGGNVNYRYRCTLMPRNTVHRSSNLYDTWFGCTTYGLYRSARLAKRATLKEYKEHFREGW